MPALQHREPAGAATPGSTVKVAVAILCNAALLAVLLPWLRRQWRWAGPGWWQVVFVLGLGLRVAVALVRNWKLEHDAGYMSRMGRYLTALLWQDPVVFWQTFTGAYAKFQFSTYLALYQSTSNTWFLIKILALLNLGSLGVGWINGVYLSLFAFAGSWLLVRSLADLLPQTPAGAGGVAFLLWPSVWFWSAGVSKETVFLSSGAWLTARVLTILYTADFKLFSRWRLARWWTWTLALALVHFYMRYFFATPLLGVLAGICLVHGLQRLGLVRRWMQAAALGVVLGLGLWLAPLFSVAFRLNKFTSQVIRVYDDAITHMGGRPHFEYADLRPTIENLVAHAPIAAINTLTRPWLGEVRDFFYVACSLENLALLGLLAVAVVALLRGRGGRLPFAWTLGLSIFCLTLAVLIGLTTPNFGLLSRYRCALMPYFLLLVLQNDYAAAALRRLNRHPRPGEPPASDPPPTAA